MIIPLAVNLQGGIFLFYVLFMSGQELAIICAKLDCS